MAPIACLQATYHLALQPAFSLMKLDQDVFRLNNLHIKLNTRVQVGKRALHILYVYMIHAHIFFTTCT